MCKIVGEVGMNFSAIDVTEKFRELGPEDKERRFGGKMTSDEEVVILDGKSQTIETFAEKCGVPNYSLLTSFGNGRVKTYFSRKEPN